MLPLLLAATLLAAPSPPGQIDRQVTRAYERVGRTAPAADPALQRAARTLALRALALPAARAASPNAIADAVSDAGGIDPSPRAIVVRADPPTAALDAFLARADLAAEPADVFGAAWAEDGAHGVAVVLLTQRRISLSPFPHRLPRAGLTQPLTGLLHPPLTRPELFLTGPDGKVAKRPLHQEGPRFQATLSFPTEGRYTLEVLATGEAGPTVAAIFHVDVGATGLGGEPEEAAEPGDPDAAREALQARINALRARQGQAPLLIDPALTGVAQAYADRMAQEHFFAHVDPQGGTLATRLRAAGVLYLRAGENLGLAPGPLAAEDGIERSPGHRQNLLDPAFTHLGLGIAAEQLPGRTQTVVVELLANPRAPAPNPRQTGDALWDALAQKRRALHLAPLRHNAQLDRLALERAQAALSLDSVEAAPPRKVEPQVFAALPDARHAAVDLFVASDVRALPPSRALADAANTQVGFAALPGNSARYGPDKIWVVIIYASTP
jgi:uncharacterized protein YkwD